MSMIAAALLVVGVAIVDGFRDYGAGVRRSGLVLAHPAAAGGCRERLGFRAERPDQIGERITVVSGHGPE